MLTPDEIKELIDSDRTSEKSSLPGQVKDTMTAIMT